MPEIRCPACGALNRIPADRVGVPARCGKCKTALPAAAPIAVTDATFESVVAGDPVASHAVNVGGEETGPGA